jgi:cysteinyl-tRNA synthetase
MEQARAQVETFRDAFRSGEGGGTADWNELVEVLDDDFNTPDALAVLHRWRRAGALDELQRGLTLFGLGSLAAEETAPAEVVDLADRRQRARAEQDFDAADRLRAEIEAAGWEVRDIAEPPGYRLVRRAA